MSGNKRLGKSDTSSEEGGAPHVLIPARNDDQQHGKCGRTQNSIAKPVSTDAAPGGASNSGPALPSPKQLAWLLVRPATALSPLDAAAVRRTEQDKEAAQVTSLARRFTALIRKCGAGQTTRPLTRVAELDAWLTDARTSGIGAVETFAAGLEQDGAAVRTALTEPWSSGQAESQINQLKILKRQSYGRASFDLLQRRVLMAA
ncbi:MAG: transposase [Acetobacteraceae bacterium]|nr:MAG: transposase [Acetobacteraceae bacterium]